MEFSFFSPVKVHFGSGERLNVGLYTKQYGHHCLIVRTPMKDQKREQLFNDMTQNLVQNGIAFSIFDQVIPNPTTEIVDKGVKIANENNVDFVIAFGGGSTIDAAKAIALLAINPELSWDESFAEFSNPFKDTDQTRRALPIVAIPTTSGTGSHITQAAVITDSAKSEKVTLFQSCLIPKQAIVDPQLMITVPTKVTAATGFDALCHSIESYLNPRASALTELLSLEAIKIIVKSLPELLNDPLNLSLREHMAYADTLAGICLSNAGAEAPHPIAEIINGYYPALAHGETLAYIYPRFMEHASEQNEVKIKDLLAIFENYKPEGHSHTLSEITFATFTLFIQKLGLSSTLEGLALDDRMAKEIMSKLSFNMPITNANQMKEIFSKSM
ncbi:iron-containing alcohol dehydrogenase [Bacillus sp. FJAT-50079]|uniref:iron-containing alcohol dehydrogenase n=1 Tax=Bacillus sp. FJAT-50079 TaxID=2833577 RepID=UPI001BCA0321|nr:iron-containing alcohol dehydrogenase [Bacillus sp. FJAT-50079]MBS4208762.1 iron-containing alcohol dehydrogenase [Bacillus sp. FJAT-50079]